jgi:hypothetical protein
LSIIHYSIKNIINLVARFLATPWRLAKRRKYADPTAEAAVRKEFQNDRFLPLVRHYIQQGETAIIFVKGYSMRPFLEHLRDRVKLAPWKELHVGDAVLAEIEPGHFVLHRIIDIQNGHDITLMGDGNIRGTEHCTINDVCGVVAEYLRPAGHVLLASDPALCRRIRLWRRLLPIRRYLLFFYRITIDERQ